MRVVFGLIDMKQNSSNQRKNTGFTLIELVVTMAIVAIFASYAIPSFNNVMERNRISTATNEMVSALVLARSEALKRSNDVTVCASTNQTSCSGTDFAQGWLVFLDCNRDGDLDDGANSVDCDNDGAVDDSEQIIKVHDEISGVFIGNAGTNVSFNFAGRSAVATFNVGKTSADIKKDVIISLVGRIRAQDHP